MRRNPANESIPKMLTCVLQHMEEFAELLVPVTDPRHQVVERVVQHLALRNKDIPEVSDVSWKVHVVQSPDVNAFVLPVRKRCRIADSFVLYVTLMQFVFRSASSIRHPCNSTSQIMLYFICMKMPLIVSCIGNK